MKVHHTMLALFVAQLVPSNEAHATPDQEEVEIAAS